MITGCNLNNNPTSKVEELLGKYQGLDKEITYDYTSLTNDSSLSKELIEKYEEVKEETIDGNTATITTEIEVINYKKVLEESKESNHETIIKELNHTKNKTTYTIDFTVTKTKKGKWIIDPITEEQKLKLLGIY